jgi:hypothetical protein
VTVEKYFFEKNEHVLQSSINVFFEELLDMSQDEFRQWVIDYRKTMLESWDRYGCPPRSGADEKKIVKSFNSLSSHPVHKFEYTDKLGCSFGKKNDVILNTARAGTEVDQFFPTMMKARINYNIKSDGHSVYDMFNDDKFLERMVKGSQRHFKRDSFYHYSHTMKLGDPSNIISADSGFDFCEKCCQNKKLMESMGYDYWISEKEESEGLSTGYYQIDQSKQLSLSAEQVKVLYDRGCFTERNISNIDVNDLKADHVYILRLFKLGHKVFPKAFTAFKIGYIQVAVNFPPMTAKYLYERFTEHVKDQETIRIYDPSSGWGGRILGAMSVRDDRRIHYIGTDPNPENQIPKEGISRYDYLANFFNENTYRGNGVFSHSNTFETFDECAEDIKNNPDFQKHKGKLDLVFTSPPYFNREGYADDAKQSYQRYPGYQGWVDGFLRPTLETAVEYLRPQRYLLWNIADILMGKEYMPLEEDSKKILESLGMEYKGFLKMAMASMPGQNRLDENGIPKCKNYCQVKGQYLKYEPVFVFWKP